MGFFKRYKQNLENVNKITDRSKESKPLKTVTKAIFIPTTAILTAKGYDIKNSKRSIWRRSR